MAQEDATVEVQFENDRFKEENVPQHTTEKVTPELNDLFEYAHSWALQKDRTDKCSLTFSSMLAAMMASNKPLCRWLQRHLGLRGVPPKRMTEGRRIEIGELPAQYRTTESFRTAFEAARTLRGEDVSQPIDARHFMAAYAVAPKYHLADFLRLRIDRRAWCLDLSDRLCELYPSERVRWKAYATLAPAMPMLEFSNDAPTGRDLLNIDREVEAFSRLIAARTTATPLSIGVFGAWGSGKSFFMRRVKDRVAGLAEIGRTEGRTSDYHGQLVQIDFNAWHYSEGTLIACLVDHIFRNLRIGEDEDAATLRRRTAELITQLDRAKQGLADREGAVEAAEARKLLAQRAVDAIEAKIPPEIAAKRRELEAAERGLAESKAEFENAQAAEQAAVDAAIARAPARAALELFRKGVADDPNVKAAARAMTDLVAEVQSVGTRWLPFVIGLGMVLAGLLIAQLVRSSLYAHAISAIAALGTVAGTALGWVKKLNAIATRGKEFQAAQAKLAAEAAEAARAAHKPKLDGLAAQIAIRTRTVGSKQTELDALRAAPHLAQVQVRELERQRAAAVDERDQAAQEVAMRQEAVAKLSTGTLLGEFLNDKSKDDYRKNLTIFTQVRNDFERLSRLMERATREYYAAGASAPQVSRIVLYIDDLDRCPEDKVIEVLRTVHLLLAFPLFVCVVAVDPRWVTACLWKAPGLVNRDGWQLGTQGERVRAADDPTKAEQLEHTFGKPATPADFLEKIFQIPLWLRPVPAEQRPYLVRALFDPDFSPMREADRQTKIAAASSIEEAAAIDAAVRTMVLTPRQPETTVERGASARPPADQTIDAVELDYLAQLGGLLDGNPRALKRFVNTYRLVKLALSDVELAVFRSHCHMLGENSPPARYLPYRMCMAQLAVLSTQRERALRMVQLADATSSEASLGGWLKKLETGGDQQLADCFRAALKEDVADPDQVAFETFALWLGRTRRYSFYL